MNNKNHAIFIGLILVLMVIPMTVLSQPSRVIGGARSELANVIVRSIIPANGYVIAGRTNSFGPGTPTKMNALIVRTNPAGIPINAMVSAGAQDEDATSMVRTSDNCYVVTGWTRSYNPSGTTNADIFVIKFNANLAIVWAKVYHMAANDFGHRAFSIIEASSLLGGGYALTGFYRQANNASRVIVLRLSVNGNVAWARTYSIVNNLYCVGRSITEVKDPSVPNVRFAVAGFVAPNANAMRNAFVMRLNRDGDILGTNIFNGAYKDEARSVVWDGSGTAPGIVAAGWTTSLGLGAPTYANVWAAKIKANGAVIWSHVYYWTPVAGGGSEQNDLILGDQSLIVTMGNVGSGYALSGLTYSRGPNAGTYPNFLLIRLNYNGTLGWNGNATVHPSVTANNRIDEAYGMVQSAAIPGLPSPGNGFAVVGRTNSFNPPAILGRYNFLFTTFARNGTRPTGCALKYKMDKIPFGWEIQNANALKNPMITANFKFIPCSVNSLPVCVD